MAGLAEEQGTKRKRVFRACDSCRAMKSKCDGARPACGRCTGYGYQCVYALSGKRNHNHRLPAGAAGSPVHDGQACYHNVAALQSVAADYGSLVRGLLPKLTDGDRPAAEDGLRRLEERMSKVHLDAPCSSPASLPQPRPGHPPGAPVHAAPPASSHSAHSASVPSGLHHKRLPAGSAARPAERYLGEVSDVRFFNMVDRALAEHGSASERSDPDQRHADTAGEDPLESYEQDDPSPEALADAAHNETAVELPAPEAAERYLDIYFSTIHVAYPFLPRALFTQAYTTYVASDRQTYPNDIWLATLYVIFAIGAYYNAAAGGTASPENDTLHEQYYRRALTLTSGSDTLERSLNHVSFLLAQCFYLLAVCRTDACWTTLGLAVRIAQSIGLHVDADPRPRPHNPHSPHNPTEGIAFRNAELRRRVWYSIYVLDRLLALQLGRPPAIHDEDCHLRLPSRLGDGDIPWLGEDCADQLAPPLLDPAVPTVGDYFLCMISLSRLIGHVLRDLYSPRGRRDSRGELGSLQGDAGADPGSSVSEEGGGSGSGSGSGSLRGSSGGSGDMLTDWLLPSTKRLDRQLLEWRRALPRKLRFDFGHAFDTSSSASAAVFRRQRNMLAIKFHHLRAVIHRPFLCLPLLRRWDGDPVGGGAGGNSPAQATHAATSILSRYETVCILEAQATAHLLHNVVDKQNLVHDFPYWQMISCLVYASSILVVASAFARKRLGGADGDGGPGGYAPVGVEDGDGGMDAVALEDDAETCLTVFEALSPNSESARLARDMMRRLKARGAAWREAHVHERAEALPPTAAAPLINNCLPAAALPALAQGQVPPMQTFDQHQSMDPGSAAVELHGGAQAPPGDFVPVPLQADNTMVAWPMLQEWPLEILDSMEWSTQFFNTMDGSM